jgi:aryl-alcohol dehydrogenase-like predicted oxidoreductase
MRTLGATGLPVSALGLGLAALGRPGYINLGHAGDVGDTHVEAMERHAHDVLDAAYEGGVRYFDAARSYGRAEAFLGSWLRRRGLSRDDVTVGSKWGYTYTADWRVDVDEHEVKDLTVSTLRRQLGETRALIGEHLALYQIHSATLESGVLDDAEVREELARLREEGVRVGFTATGPRQAATIERALEVGGFDAVQATWNVHERAATDALAAAHEAGLGVIVKEALANGRLTERGDADGRLTAAARERGTTPDALALAAVLARPWVDVVLSGAATVDTVRSNLAALEAQWDARAEEELAALEEPADEYWERRSELAWN